LCHGAAAIGSEGELKPVGGWGEEFPKFPGPFGDDDAVLVEVVVPAEGDEFCGGFQAIEVEMEYGKSAAMVFVNEAEGGAGDGGGGAKACDKALGPVGFTGTEIADEGDAGAGHSEACGGLTELGHGFWGSGVAVHGVAWEVGKKV
jgi:hypothetical protein